MQLRKLRLRQLIAITMAFSLSACTNTRIYRPAVNKPLPLQLGNSYLVYFVSGKHETSVITAITELGFSDKAGHSHLFSEVDEVKEKAFSFLKTTGFAAGVLVVLAAIGAYLVGKTIEDAFEKE